MFERILRYIKTHIRLTIIISCVSIVLLCVFGLVVHYATAEPGIDLLVKPKEYTNHDSAYSYDGYLYLKSEDTEFRAGDTVTLTVSTAYFDQLEDAEKSEYAYFRVVHSDYLEVEVVGASERTQKENQLDQDLPPYNDVDAVYTFTEFDPVDFVYQPVGVFDRITRESLPYTVTIIVKVKDDAPENFEDELWIFTSASQVNGRDQYGNPINMQKSCRVGIIVVRDGETVTIEADTDLPRR